MADLRISELAALAGANLAAADLLPVVDVSASETKKITIQDAIGYGVTLIADATIPGAKIVFNSGTIPGSALVASAVGTTQLADDGVTFAKLADESTVDLVTTLPAAGAYIGQLALDTDDSKVYCWDGSSWVSIKAAGSVNTIIGDTASIVNLSVATSGDTVTITTSLDNTGGAAQFLAGPTASSGPVSYRQIASGDLPTATSGGKGAVSVSGEGLAVSGDQLVIDNTVAASGSTYSVVQYSTKGLVTDGRAITSVDLPAATSVDKGAVTPGTGLAVSAGALNHSNAVAAGTATKVSYDAQGHITAAQSLLASDIPELPATKLTSGTLGSSLFGTNSITGDKLADSSTVQFGGAANTAGVVTFPTADFRGQQFFDALNGDLYLYDGAAWQPITITAGELIYAGTYDASLNEVKSTTAAGTAAGLVAGNALPAAAASNLRYYVVVADSGTGVAPAPVVALAPPDMLVSSGTAWELIDVSNGIAGQLASNISFTPSGSIASTNVQTAIQELDSEKISAAGATITGNLEIGSTGSLTWEGSTADAYETTLTVVDPTADRTITLPNVTGTVVTTGDSGTVTSTMIADGTIVDNDINASAAIVDTKLATISTAGKVSNSATTAASANTASAIVARDGSGNFTAGTITASLTGAASLNVLKTGDTMSGALSVPLGTFSAPSVYPGTDTDTGLYSPGANQIALGTNGAQRLAIDSTGRVLIGPGTARAVGGGTVGTLAIETLGLGASVVRNSADTSGGIIALGKSRGTAAGDSTAVQLDDILGEIRFAGANGSDLTSVGAHIRALVDGEVGTAGDVTDMPCRLAFSTTPDGAATATERLVIDSSGNVEIKAQGDLRFADSDSSNWVGFQAPATVASNVTWTLPAADGTASQVLSTNGSGTLSWAASASDAITEGNTSAEVIDTGSDGRFVVTTEGTERMRITSAGRVLHGATAPTAENELFSFQGVTGATSTLSMFAVTEVGQYPIRTWNSATSGTRQQLLFMDGAGTARGSITTNGSATSFNTTSDYRLKENVELLAGATERLSQIPVHRFNFIGSDATVDGFLAHEVQAVVPECVIGTKDEADDDGNPVYQGIDQSKLVPLLTAALQEAIAKIETLETRLTALESA